MRALKIAATGMSAQQLRVETISNNLANANTTGFKPSSVVLGERAREPQRLDTLTNSRQLLAQLGGGTEIAYSGLDLRQGSIERTGLRTDLALKKLHYNVVVKRSAIHNWGLFTTRPVTKDSMVVEYKGQVIIYNL